MSILLMLIMQNIIIYNLTQKWNIIYKSLPRKLVHFGVATIIRPYGKLYLFFNPSLNFYLIIVCPVGKYLQNVQTWKYFANYFIVNEKLDFIQICDVK